MSRPSSEIATFVQSFIDVHYMFDKIQHASKSNFIVMPVYSIRGVTLPCKALCQIMTLQ